MTRKKRKISFYVINVNKEDFDATEKLNELIEYINNLSGTQKRKTILGNKYGLISTSRLRQSGNRRTLFKSATNNFRPPLLNKVTVEERESPKTLDEGETQKTHLVTKKIGEDLIAVLEKFQDGLSIVQIMNYLNSFSTNLEVPFRFTYETIANQDFLEELRDLRRVTIAEVFVDKQLLTGPALNYSERIDTAKHDIVITVKAENRQSIEDFALDAFAVLSGGTREIQKMRVTGRNSDNNVVILNTDRIERQEYVNPLVNDETGEIDSEELFRGMDNALNNV